MKDAKCVIEELELLKKFCEENIAEATTVSVCRVFEGCRVAVVDAIKLIEEQDERIAIMTEGKPKVRIFVDENGKLHPLDGVDEMGREKVIEYLENEICRAEKSVNNVWLECVEVKLLRDALALLKEQEVVEPTLIREGRNKHCNDYVCPRCDNEVIYEQNYCSECGVQFLWEGR